MVPTTTSAQRLLDLVLPQIAGRIEGSAVRVPTASVSAVDLVVMTERSTTAAEVSAVLAAAGGVIGATDRALVSTDLRAMPESIVMALPETRVTRGGMLRVFGWYDNEWGFSNRMLDVARWMGRTLTRPGACLKSAFVLKYERLGCRYALCGEWRFEPDAVAPCVVQAKPAQHRASNAFAPALRSIPAATGPPPQMVRPCVDRVAAGLSRILFCRH
jgi:hypothetical protein